MTETLQEKVAKSLKGAVSCFFISSPSPNGRADFPMSYFDILAQSAINTVLAEMREPDIEEITKAIQGVKE